VARQSSLGAFLYVEGLNDWSKKKPPAFAGGLVFGQISNSANIPSPAWGRIRKNKIGRRKKDSSFS